MPRRVVHRSLRRSIDGWLGTLSQIMGLIGLAYELAIDKLRNPTALMVFGGLAGLPDIWKWTSTVRRRDTDSDSEGE